MMINWIEYRKNKVINSDGNIISNEDEILDLINNPFQILRQYGLQVGRTINGKHQKVFVWSPHQQFVLREKLMIKQASKSIHLDRSKFWEIIPEHMIDLLDIENDHKTAPYVGYYGYINFEISRLMESYNNRQDKPIYPYLVLDFPTRILAKSKTESIYIEIDLAQISDLSFDIENNELEFSGIKHSTGYNEYISDLKSIITHIRNGDIYQANYTQQFMVSTPDDIDLVKIYRKIITNQFLPHSAYLNYQNYQVMSLSPELFMHVKKGEVITKPIKGTRPRGLTLEQDTALIEELTNSTKDQAELAMIVDLLRNDLGKSAIAGSVNVDYHAKVETYENVHHMVSKITSNIENKLSSSWRMFLRALPGGSISGVPKLRSLEVIEAHEKVPREIYTGNIGYIGINGDMELNIAIRTIIKQNKLASFNAGGGIVYDSDPVEEYLESLHKAKHLVNYLGNHFVGHLVYYNGSFEADRILIKPKPPGIFETILVEDGQIHNWDDHLSRLQNGLKYYQLKVQLPSIDDLHQLLRLNLALEDRIRLNIYVWAEKNSHVLAKVQSHHPPNTPHSLLLSSKSFSVPEPMKSGLKSLEYNAYKQSTRKAIDSDCWDMILYDENQYILEGGRSTIFLFFDGKWMTPRDNVVEGTVRKQLIEQGIVTPTQIKLDVLETVSSIAVGNALNGVIPINTILDKGGDFIWNNFNNKKVKELIDAIQNNQNYG